MFNPLKPAVLAIAVFCLYGVNANADTLRDVRCANGKTVHRVIASRLGHRLSCSR